MTVEELRAAILAADDIDVVPVATPEWPAVDGQIHVRTLSGLQRDRFIKALRRVVDPGDASAPSDAAVEESSHLRLAAAALCDATGATLFTQADVQALGAKSSVALKRVIDAASALNGLGPAAAEDAKKNSALTPIGASSTA